MADRHEFARLDSKRDGTQCCLLRLDRIGTSQRLTEGLARGLPTVKCIARQRGAPHLPSLALLDILLDQPTRNLEKEVVWPLARGNKAGLQHDATGGGVHK